MPYKCMLCDYVAETLEDLERHIRFTHGIMGLGKRDYIREWG